MRKVIIISCVLAILFLNCSPASMAQLVSDETKVSLLNATPTKRAEAKEMIDKEYPDFAKDTFLYLSQTYPNFITRIIRVKIETLKKIDGKTLASIYLDVSNDIESKYSEPRKGFRKEVREIIVKKYPELHADLRSFHENNGFGKKFSALVNEKYPTFKSDCLKVMKEKRPALMLTIGRDAISTVIKKDPALIIEVKIAATELIESQYPELLKEVSKNGSIPEFLELRKLMRENPEFAQALFEKIDSQYGKRIKEVKRAVVANIIENHAHELLSVSEDLITMIEKKYPELPKEAVLIAIDCGKEFKTAIRDKHRDFFDEVLASRERRFPNLLKDLVGSIDKHWPDLRKNMGNAIDKEFAGIDKNLNAYASKKYPGLEEKIRKIIK